MQKYTTTHVFIPLDNGESDFAKQANAFCFFKNRISNKFDFEYSILVLFSIYGNQNGVNICLRFYIRYNIRNLPLFIALVVKVLSEKIFVIDRKQNVKQISYDGRECACLSISILSFSKTTHAMLNCLFMPNIRQQQLFIKVTAHFKCFCISASTIKFRRAFTVSRIQKMFIFKR